MLGKLIMPFIAKDTALRFQKQLTLHVNIPNKAKSWLRQMTKSKD